MTDLQLISLFDGIAGFPLAFSRAGGRTAATVELDKAAAGVAAEHFPDAVHFADVTEVTADDFLALGIDPGRAVVSAGWPCTDLSLAGLRLGLGGARSGLVGEVFRLLLGIRPRWVVLENVPGLLSSVCPCAGGGACDDSHGCDAPHLVRGGACGRRVRRGRATGAGRCMALHGGGMGTVLRRLGECGYGLAYRVLDAQHFGVPQRRRRVVIVGCLGDAAAAAEVLLEPEGRSGHPAAGAAARARAARRTSLIPAGAGRPGGVAPTLAGGGKRGYRVDAETAAGGGLISGTPVIAFGHTNGMDPQASEDVTPTLRSGRTSAAGQAAMDTAGVRRLTPVECERLQGFPDGWTAVSAGKPQADSARYRQLGNSIAVPVFTWVADGLVAVDNELRGE